MPRYYGVIGNRDYIKYRGERLPFWHFLDEQPSGWLCSLAYRRDDIPADRHRIWDCGAWSYKAEDEPRLGKALVTPTWALEQYQKTARAGDFVIAPDHMLIPGLGDIEARRRFNVASAEAFIDLASSTELVPMATVHGATIEEKIESARQLQSLGYRRLAVGGLAGQASRRQMILETVRAVREAVPGVWLHVLGLSVPSFVGEWARLGVNSFDGASHFRQAFTAGKFYGLSGGTLTYFQAARQGESVSAPRCDCRACSTLREDGIDTRRYGSNESNMGRAAHNMNMLMRAHQDVLTEMGQREDG